ncbi:MAG: prolyl oligopeptidase family serine peptidase [Salinimicrobium sp.]
MKTKIFYLFLALLYILLMLPLSLHSQEQEGFKKEHFINNKDTLNYRVLFPENFTETKKYPIVLFLHGAGERGADNEVQLTHGSSLFLNPENRKNFPAIVLFPQCPQDDYWAKVEVNRDVKPFEFNYKNEEEPTNALRLAMALLTSFTNKEYADTNRIYVGGLSMGGMGTFEIISRKPDLFAGAFAICGGANPEIAEAYPKAFNIWIFHGEKDDVVPPEFSKTMAREINSHGGNAKLSLYPNDNHNSWDSAFSEPYLLPWLFSQNKNE